MLASDDGAISGSFDSTSSPSGDEDEAPELPERIRSESAPPSVEGAVNKKKSTLESRKEKEFEFYHDLSAVHSGILQQRKMLAVWQKRYCKVKNECLICYRLVIREEVSNLASVELVRIQTCVALSLSVPSFLPRLFPESVVMQISFVMLYFLLVLDIVQGGTKVFDRGRLL